MKTWVFVEGTTEENLIKWLARKHLPSQADLIPNLKEYINTTPTNKKLFYLHNSKGVDKIPHDIIDNHHYITQSQCNKILIVCDVEKDTPCVVERKNKILKITNKKISQEMIKFICFAPMLEELYCFEKETTTKVINKLFNERHDDHLNEKQKQQIIMFLNHPKSSPKTTLETCMKSFKLTYLKTVFSETFFSQFDFENSQHKTITRLFNWLNE